MDNDFYNRVGGERISDRQVNELIGLTRGLLADGKLNSLEVEFLHKWLAVNTTISSQPLVRGLYQRISEVLADGVVDESEMAELVETLGSFANTDSELGEPLKATTLPLCKPAPTLGFASLRYCFTGTFNYGQRKVCEKEVVDRGAIAGSLTKKTDVLVVGVYATESWKHSSFGNKILQASEWRDAGQRIAIVSEDHWVRHL